MSERLAFADRSDALMQALTNNPIGKRSAMKFSSPWSTDIVDIITDDPVERGLLKTWIWCDRVMWIGVTVLVGCTIGLILQ